MFKFDLLGQFTQFIAGIGGSQPKVYEPEVYTRNSSVAPTTDVTVVRCTHPGCEVTYSGYTHLQPLSGLLADMSVHRALDHGEQVPGVVTLGPMISGILNEVYEGGAGEAAITMQMITGVPVIVRPKQQG